MHHARRKRSPATKEKSAEEPMTREALVSQVVLDPAAEAERRERFPAGAAIAFADLEEQARVGALDRLREIEPVSWVPALGGWLVTAHELGREVLGRRDGFTVAAAQNLVRASLGVMMLTTDPPEHDRQRCPFDEPFRMRPVREHFERPVRGRVDGLLTGLAARGEAELVTEFAAPFAIGVAGDVLGLSLDDVPRIQGVYEAFAGAMVYDGDAAPQRRADAARAELDAILHAELVRVRRRPDGSVTAAIANDPAGLADDEIVAQLRVILFGAIETVESMVVNGVLMLLRHPDQLDALRADPDLAANAVEEAMRLVPPVAFIERWTNAETTLGGVALGRGEFVGVSTVACGRDPSVFPDPTCFEVRRATARHHLAFGFGPHHCLGFNLARIQGAIAVHAVLDRLPGLALAAAAEPRGFAFRRPPELRLRWPRAVS
jgi:cytochrome P450